MQHGGGSRVVVPKSYLGAHRVGVERAVQEEGGPEGTGQPNRVLVGHPGDRGQRRDAGLPGPDRADYPPRSPGRARAEHDQVPGADHPGRVGVPDLAGRHPQERFWPRGIQHRDSIPGPQGTEDGVSQRPLLLLPNDRAAHRGLTRSPGRLPMVVPLGAVIPG